MTQCMRNCTKREYMLVGKLSDSVSVPDSIHILLEKIHLSTAATNLYSAGEIVHSFFRLQQV